ncbi:ankyrin repeat domain-containing protein [Streptomyces sp. NPDC048383]|uniref:ankyrin repeat domain-containing protein n=1 Tax=Streptomyces sp. NPDC048383 TaxID=3155386 RepID=UPI003432C4B8
MTDTPWTPVHGAVESNDFTALTRCLAEGADVDEVCGGLTLLMHAIDVEGDTGLKSGIPPDCRLTAILLAYGADPNATTPAYMAPIDLADFYGHDIAYRLLDRLINPPLPAAVNGPRSGLWSWRRSRKD